MLSDSSAASFLAESGLGVVASDGSTAGAVRVAAAGIEAGRRGLAQVLLHACAKESSLGMRTLGGVFPRDKFSGQREPSSPPTRGDLVS